MIPSPVAEPRSTSSESAEGSRRLFGEIWRDPFYAHAETQEVSATLIFRQALLHGLIPSRYSPAYLPSLVSGFPLANARTSPVPSQWFTKPRLIRRHCSDRAALDPARYPKNPSGVAPGRGFSCCQCVVDHGGALVALADPWGPRVCRAFQTRGCDIVRRPHFWCSSYLVASCAGPMTPTAPRLCSRPDSFWLRPLR